MSQPFSAELCGIADSMGIALYGRFSENDGAKCLKISPQSLALIRGQGKISFIQLDANKVEYFGYQLLQYLLGAVCQTTPAKKQAKGPDRIIRCKEVLKITGVTRTTIWRWEEQGKFPARINLGVGSVGWRLSEVEAWISSREE
jgi:predicted DNA-binding transcriptional regulator AlpA